MLVAPVAGDKVTLQSTGGPAKVSSYTALKPEPAVYLTEPLESGERFTFFSDILSLNGVEVEQDSSNLLKASSLVKRKHNLPQVGDSIVTGLVETAFKQESMELEVTGVTLSGKEPRSLVVKCGKTVLNLTDIQDIKRKRGFEKFDRSGFLKYYVDYLPLGAKKE
jgi:hypothetical protein